MSRPFVVLWREWLRDSDEHWSTKLLGHTMSTHMSTAGEGCDAGLELLTRETSMSETQTKRARRVLLAHGWLTCTVGGGRGNTNLYAANKPGLTDPVSEPKGGLTEPVSSGERGPHRPGLAAKGGLERAERGPETNGKGASLAPEVVALEVEELEVELLPTQKRRPRPPDPIWDAVIEACGLDPTQMTNSARGACNSAVRDLRKVGATPALIAERAAAFQRTWPSMSLTPTALAKQWAQLAAKPANVAHTPAAAANWLATRNGR